MKLRNLLLISLLPIILTCQPTYNYHKVANGINICTPEGTLGIYPVSDRVVRIMFYNEHQINLPELVLKPDYTVPEFRISETSAKIAVSIKFMQIEFNKKTGNLSFSDPSGKIFLKEKSGTRKLLPDSLMGCS